MILGDQVMHGAVIEGQDIVFMTYLITRKVCFLAKKCLYVKLRGHSMEILIFWSFHISRMSAAG